MTQPTNRRYARRALVLGAVAAATRAATLVAATCALDLSDATLLLAIANPAGTVVALAGAGYCAIASHRREWGVTLVVAWILSALAALFIPDVMFYASF